MDILCPKWEIETVKRLGKYNGRVRPVIVTTTTTSRKIQLFKKKKTLENTGIYIKEDYTPAVLQKRKQLQEELQLKRLSGKKVMLRYDKIVELNPQKQHTYVSKKRLLSECPEAENKGKTLNKEDQAKQAHKKNKAQNIRNFLNSSQFNTTPKASTKKTKTLICRRQQLQKINPKTRTMKNELKALYKLISKQYST
ncbi:unnamed protein product [Leptidea sinapis]|uniref:Uncharacterized protein n=1 Tax=Leptidea sinapis TaxID=189913 RepID=A0A5E4R509_9NEOP|nr:unnamed protein product [Leptidea sinapis]